MEEPLTISVEIIKDIDHKLIENYEDKVLMGIARKTLDFTDDFGFFPRLSGDLEKASMAEGVVKDGYLSYYLGARGVYYAPYVWEMGEGTNWTNPNTKPQWYRYTYETYRNTIMQDAVKLAESEVKE